MRRKPFTVLTRASLVLGMVWAAATRGAGAPAPALLKDIAMSERASGSEVLLRIEGEYSFRPAQASEHAIVIDLVGVKAGPIPASHEWDGSVLAGYHLTSYIDAANQPVVRVEVATKHLDPFKVERQGQSLRVLFGQGPAAGATTGTETASLRPASVAAPATSGVDRERSAASSKATALVSGITINPGVDGGTVVEVLTTRRAAYHVLHLRHPDRVVVDLEGALYTGRNRTYAAQSPVLRGVRVGQFRSSGPAIVRVVADLAGHPTYEVQTVDGRVRIELKTRRRARQVDGGSTITAHNLSPGKDEARTLPVAKAPPAVTDNGKAKARSAPQTDYQAALPASSGSREIAAAPRPEPSVQTPDSLRAARAARILAANADSGAVSQQPQNPPAPATPPPSEPASPAPAQPPAAPATPAQAPTQAPAAPATQAQAPPQAPAAPETPTQEKPKYTGEPISLNLKEVDLKDFFRLIHEISGLNLIIDPNVTGNVTLVLDSVPWDQALDIVLKNNRLDKTLEGNVLRIAKMETLAAEQEESKKLTEAREQGQPLVTVFRPVNYAKAADISTMLKGWTGGGALSKRGNVLVDTRANTLIISDIQSQIPVIESIIAKLDRKAKQVAIEARIVLATAAFSRSLQSALTGATANVSGTTVTGGSTGSGAAVTANVVPPPRITIQQTSAGGFGAVAISNEAGRYILTAAIAAAETKSQAKTISRPTIVTQNNVQGTVQQGSQIPIQTSINNTISIQYIAATLQLSVTPQVTEDGNIFLNVNVTNASPGPVLTSAGPSINTQSATTQVMVPNGGTVVFGGVTVSSRSRSATYVPVIGNIPIVGHLFKTSNVQDSDNELLFFVSPKILPG